MDRHYFEVGHSPGNDVDVSRDPPAIVQEFLGSPLGQEVGVGAQRSFGHMAVGGSLQDTFRSAQAAGHDGGDPVEAVLPLGMDASQGSQKDDVPVPVLCFGAVLVDLFEDFGDLFRKVVGDQDVVLEKELVGFLFGTSSSRLFPTAPVRKVTTDGSGGRKVPGHNGGVGPEVFGGEVLSVDGLDAFDSFGGNPFGREFRNDRLPSFLVAVEIDNVKLQQWGRSSFWFWFLFLF